MPSEARLPEELPRLSAMGSAPKIFASVVINMGLNREVAAAITASRSKIVTRFCGAIPAWTA